MLQEIKDAKPNDTRYPVVLHGFVTTTRTTSGYTDYLNLIDPKLRTMIQVVVTKQPPAAQPTANINAGKLNNDSLGEPASQADEEVLENIHDGEDLDASVEAGSKIAGTESQRLPKHGSDHDLVDARPSAVPMARSEVRYDEQALLTAHDPKPSTNPDSEKRTEQDMQTQSFNPVCRSYKKLRPHTPVVVHGIVCQPKSPYFSKSVEANADGSDAFIIKRTPTSPRKHITPTYQDPYVGSVQRLDWLIIRATLITPLNEFPSKIIAKSETNFPPEQRHLQLRTKHYLRRTIRARSKAMAQTRKFMFMKGFDEIDTPLLFKSTPEGAREFMVPTRTKGMAYALPQSPQQYKQILMASGVSRYFQFARCFRDEDMRADRQPEFTQVWFLSALILDSLTDNPCSSI
jgi:hypothetical protein